MKKVLIFIMALCATVFAGCKSLPTPEVLETTSYQIGAAAGYVANQTKIDADSRVAVVEIISEVSKIVPENEESFETAWTPVANEIIEKFVADGKLDQGQATIVRVAFNVAVKAIDYEFTIRYPKAREYSNLVSSAVRGFTNGFLSTFSVTDTMRSAPVEYDIEAYNYLTNIK